jgi:NAD(P)-dependent dehydrogenase (short-subunit alcohol dehydrogenase family)
MSESSSARVAVVTGASSGIGKAAAKALAQQGWRVIGVGRDPERTATAEAEIRAAAAPATAVDMIRADLSSLADTARAADAINAMTDRLDVLINNAGGIVGEHTITAEGHEATFAGNHLAPFLLTRKLLTLLEAAAKQEGPGKVRILAVSSTGHEHCPAINFDDLNWANGYNSGGAYCQAKLANVLFTRELARRVGDAGIVSHAMHPGVVASNFGSDAKEMREYMKTQAFRADTPEQAAETLVWLAANEQPGRSTGGYWHRKEEATPSEAGRDDEAARRLWELSEELVAGY